MIVEFIPVPGVESLSRSVMLASCGLIIFSLLVLIHDLHSMPPNDNDKPRCSLYVWSLMVTVAMLGLGEGMKFMEALQGEVHRPPSLATNSALTLLCVWSLYVRPIRRWASAIYACRMHRHERDGEYFLTPYERYAEPPCTTLRNK